MKLKILLCIKLLLLTFFCGMAGAAENAVRCRAAGLSPDAPLYYLELMSSRDADRDWELENALFADMPEALPPGAWLKLMKARLDEARLKAGIRPAGGPQARLSAEEALKLHEELEKLTLWPVDPHQVDRARDAQPPDLPWQYRINYSYYGLDTRNIIPADLNHDGITDFMYQADPVLQLIAYQFFVGCGDNYYTPVGMFIARYADYKEDVVMVPGKADGALWDEFQVIAPDLPDERNPTHDDPLFNWARRLIGFDRDMGIYREMHVEPLN